MKNAEEYENKNTHGKTSPEISVEEARNLIRKDDHVILIDLRSNAETTLAHIRGARFVPLGLIEGESNKLSGDREAPILVYCASGDRSVMAAERLRAMGFNNARSIIGGWNAWLNSGGEIVTDSKLSIHQLNRYSRNMLLKEIGEEGQLKLLGAKVLLVGAGGLASSAGLYLAASGVGTLGIVDYDWVDLSNLNRQIFHGTEDVGKLKVDSARAAVERINPGVKTITFAGPLTPENAFEIIKDFDIVMDASDNAGTKFLLNDACYFLNKPYVFGGAVGFDGQASLFWPKERGPCMRCLFPKPPPRNLVPTCSEAGVLGVVPGQIGLVQATEVVKLILGIGTSMIGKYYIYNALSLETRIVETGKSVDCPLCGSDPRIKDLVGSHREQYERGFCSTE